MDVKAIFALTRSEGEARALTKLNRQTERYGLTLSRAQAVSLVRAREASLRARGRVEFGESATAKVIAAFCDSPYITRDGYTETLIELTDAFYAYKNETDDQIPDEDILAYMRRAFDGSCQGSIELLTGRALFDLTRGEPDGAEEKEDGDGDE